MIEPWTYTVLDALPGPEAVCLTVIAAGVYLYLDLPTPMWAETMNMTVGELRGTFLADPGDWPQPLRDLVGAVVVDAYNRFTDQIGSG